MNNTDIIRVTEGCPRAIVLKGSIEEMQIGIERMNATAAALSVISGTVNENIRQIGSEIDLFKV